VAKAKADVAKVKYEIEKAKVEALLAEVPPAMGPRLEQAIKDKETALQDWNDAKTTHTLIMQTAAAAAASARPAG